jgi:hypothetical protein
VNENRYNRSASLDNRCFAWECFLFCLICGSGGALFAKGVEVLDLNTGFSVNETGGTADERAFWSLSRGTWHLVSPRC